MQCHALTITIEVIDYRYFGISKSQFVWQRATYLLILLGAWIGSLVHTFRAPHSQPICESDVSLGDGKGGDSHVDAWKYPQLIILVAIVLLACYIEWLNFLERHEDSETPYGNEKFGEVAHRWRKFWGGFGIRYLARVLQYTWPLSALVALGVYMYILFKMRREASDKFGSEEDEWGVGQVLALVLFINPFVDFFFSLWQVHTEYVTLFL